MVAHPNSPSVGSGEGLRMVGVRPTESGQLRWVWFGEAPLEEAILKAGLRRRGQRDGGSRVATGGLDVWVKGGRLTAKSALRHHVRRLALGRPFPRLREAENLAWLRAHGIRAARPVCAGIHVRRGLVDAQFLATEFVPDSIALDALRESDPKRFECAKQSARALALAMHAAGFEHRDCYLRNFLITQADEAVAIDTWRGGPRRRLSQRAAARDLADFDAS